MSTDLPQQAPPSGRPVPSRGAPPPRTGASGVAIVVALVAALLGFFILKKIDNNNTSINTTIGNGSVTSNPISTGSPTVTSTGSTAVTSAPVAGSASTLARAGIKVVVANSSGVKGAAGKVSTSLKTLGYDMLPAANASGKTRTASLIFAAAGSEAAAAQVIADLKLSNVTVQSIPTDATQIPLLASSRQGAAVVVILGSDLASGTGSSVTAPPSISPGVTSKATTTSAP